MWPTWTVVLVAPILIVVFVAFARAPIVADPPPPRTIPDADFEALLRYVNREVFLDSVEARVSLFPDCDGREAALKAVAGLRLENLEALLYTRVIP